MKSTVNLVSENCTFFQMFDDRILWVSIWIGRIRYKLINLFGLIGSHTSSIDVLCNLSGPSIVFVINVN